jgi:CDP-diacylglycerol--serine O-phosphatidyltransferase
LNTLYIVVDANLSTRKIAYFQPSENQRSATIIFMKRKNLVPNLITSFGLACGLFVIFKANLKFVGPYQLLHGASLLLLLAALADVLDGMVARLIHAESEFGVIFDSLADAISFGVAPSVLFLRVLSLEVLNPLAFVAVLTAMLFTIGGVLRLVRFSVTIEEETQKNFRGLPIPGAAACAVSANLFLYSPLFKSWIDLSMTTTTLILIGLMLLLTYLMVSKWRFPSLKALHVRVPSPELIMVTVGVVLVLLYGMLYFFPLMAIIVSLGYVLVGWGLSITQVIRGKRQPDDDE